MRRRLLKWAFAFAVAGVPFGMQAQGQETIKVGGIFSLSGPAAPFGIPERDVVEILTKRINAGGGIKGRKLEVIFHDDQTNPTEAARGATKLIQQDKVVAIIGSTIGTGTLALMPIAMNNKIPVLAPNGTIDLTSKKHAFFPWVFRISTNEQFLQEEMLDRGVHARGYKSMAIMYQEDAYGKGAMEFAIQFAEKHGIKVVATVGAPLSAIDLTAAATKIRNANPEVVLLIASAPNLGAAFVRTAKRVGVTAPIVGSGSLNQKSFLDAAGPAGEGVRMVSAGNWDDPSGKQVALGKILQEGNKTPSGFGELLGSTGILVLAEGLRHVDGPPTAEKIRDALETICNFDGTYLDGKICYSKEQHEGLFKDALIEMEVKDGKFRTVR